MLKIHNRCFSSSDDSKGTVHTDLWSYDLKGNVWTKVKNIFFFCWEPCTRTSGATNSRATYRPWCGVVYVMNIGCVKICCVNIGAAFCSKYICGVI
jgi:hypothetical protein